MVIKMVRLVMELINGDCDENFSENYITFISGSKEEFIIELEDIVTEKFNQCYDQLFHNVDFEFYGCKFNLKDFIFNGECRIGLPDIYTLDEWFEVNNGIGRDLS